MRSISKYIQTSALIVVAAFNLNIAYAQQGQEPTGTRAPTQPGVDSLVGGYGINANSILNKVPFDNSKTAQLGLAQSSQFDGSASKAISSNTSDALMSIFSNVNAPNSITKNILYSFKAYACAPAKPVQGMFARVFSSQESCQKELTASTDPKEIYSNVDINALIGPLTYDAEKSSSQSNNPDDKNKQDKAAKNFINAATQTVNPFELFDINGLLVAPDEKHAAPDINQKLLTDPQLKQYLSMLRVYTAAQSVAISNFYQLYNERKPIDKPDDALKSAIKSLQELKLLKADETPSPLQLEKIMATQRITDPNWQKFLVNDSPAALQRQMVVLLAQNLAEAYQTRMTLERLNATLSMMLLQQNLAARTQLDIAKAQIKPTQSTTVTTP